jgi:hypothetical protein
LRFLRVRRPVARRFEQYVPSVSLF